MAKAKKTGPKEVVNVGRPIILKPIGVNRPLFTKDPQKPNDDSRFSVKFDPSRFKTQHKG